MDSGTGTGAASGATGTSEGDVPPWVLDRFASFYVSILTPLDRIEEAVEKGLNVQERITEAGSLANRLSLILESLERQPAKVEGFFQDMTDFFRRAQVAHATLQLRATTIGASPCSHE